MSTISDEAATHSMARSLTALCKENKKLRNRLAAIAASDAIRAKEAAVGGAALLPPLVGRVVEADFEKGTLTLEMIGPYYAAYRVYELVPNRAAPEPTL